MRISFILSSLWLSGGVRVIMEYANRLAARGHYVTLVTPGGTLDPEMLDELASDVTVRESRVVRASHLSSVGMLRLTWSLAQAVPPSDVVISTHTPTTAAGFLATHLLRRGRPVWFFMDYQEMFVGRPYEDWLMRHALSWHERALVLSDYGRQELHAYSSGDVVVVGLGLSDPEIFHPLPPEARRSADDFQVILFLGDMRPRKGLSDFLRAVGLVYERVNNIKLLIVSKEDCQIDSRVPFETIRRPGRAQLAQSYATCDVFVSASWREGFGLPPLEAMACGVPVVLTDSGGVREYARPGENCLMVPPRDPAALAEAIYHVLSEPAMARRLALNGPLTAAQFTWDGAVDRFEAAIAELVGANRR